MIEAGASAVVQSATAELEEADLTKTEDPRHSINVEERTSVAENVAEAAIDVMTIRITQRRITTLTE